MFFEKLVVYMAFFATFLFISDRKSGMVTYGCCV